MHSQRPYNTTLLAPPARRYESRSATFSTTMKFLLSEMKPLGGFPPGCVFMRFTTSRLPTTFAKQLSASVREPWDPGPWFATLSTVEM